MEVISDISAESILGLTERNVKSGSRIGSDGLQSYRSLEENGYHHDRVVEDKKKPESLRPALHFVVTLSKRWILGTLQGRIGTRIFLPMSTGAFSGSIGGSRKTEERGFIDYWINVYPHERLPIGN
jgi:hypothetical protein